MSRASRTLGVVMTGILSAIVTAIALAGTPAGATALAPGDPANLAVTVDGTPDPVGPGGTVTYTITVSNAGPEPAVNATLSVPTPANTTFTSFSPPPGWVPATPPAGGTGTVTAGSALLPVGAPATFTVVMATTGGSQVDLTATVGSAIPDPDPANNTATKPIAIRDTADLSVTATGAPTPTPAGASISYSIAVTNNGPGTATNTVLSAPIPTGTTFTSLNARAGWRTAAPPAGGVGTVKATLDSLPPGQSATFTLVVTVSPGTTDGATLTLTPSVTSAATDPNAANSTATTESTVANTADLAVSVSAGTGPTTRGGTIAYTITLTNAGPVAATTTAISADIPAGTLFESFTVPDGWAPATPEVGKGGAVSATIASFPSGGTASFTLALTTQGDGDISFTAGASTTTLDPNSSNDRETQTTRLAAPSPTTGTIGTQRGGLPLSGSALVRLAGATVVLLGFTILLMATARSRRYRRS
jgi:uncharacterized repeat protein (TIGR01451 family)